MRVQTILRRNRRKFRMVIRPGFLATRFVFMTGIIGLLKPGRCVRPWNKSDFLDVSATGHPEKDCANNQRFHGGIAQNELSVRRNIKPVGEPTSPLPSGRQARQGCYPTTSDGRETQSPGMTF